MLSLSNIRAFRQQIKDLEILCDDILSFKERQHIFKNADDMEEAKYNREYVPQDFYKFQLFNFYIELCKDKKGYYIYSENFVPEVKELRELCVNYSNQYRLSGDFQKSLEVFRKFCVLMIHQYFNTEKELFYIY